MKRATKPMKRSRLKPVSKKVQRNRPAFDAVYAEVDARSGGICEVTLPIGVAGWVLALGRCATKATEHHHTRKPRRSWHAKEWIIHICADHHQRVDAPYSLGRLETNGIGDGTFRCEVVYAASKFAHRKSLDSARQTR